MHEIAALVLSVLGIVAGIMLFALIRSGGYFQTEKTSEKGVRSARDRWQEGSTRAHMRIQQEREQ